MDGDLGLGQLVAGQVDLQIPADHVVEQPIPLAQYVRVHGVQSLEQRPVERLAFGEGLFIDGKAIGIQRLALAQGIVHGLHQGGLGGGGIRRGIGAVVVAGGQREGDGAGQRHLVGQEVHVLVL
ncbi:hypothetical protein D3C75_1150740 [compost metagenome]